MNIVIDNAVYGYKEIFSSFGKVIALPGKEINNDIVRNAEILIIRSRTKVNEVLLKNSNVKFIGSAVAGTDHVDINYLQKNNINFSSASGCNANAVSEYVISALVNLANDFNFKLKDKTLAIIGVGNVGSKVDAKAKKLGIKTLLNDPPRKQKENLKNFVSLKDSLKADIITVHTPLTFEGEFKTYNLITEDELNKLNNKNKIIINTARGGVINENAWIKINTLANIVDCWLDEPNINTELLAKSYLATPHIAGHSIDAKFMGSYIIYKELCKFLKATIRNEIKNLIKFDSTTITADSLKKAIKQVYDFDNDDLRNIKLFEQYRINYPRRLEWTHFNNKYLDIFI